MHGEAVQLRAPAPVPAQQLGRARAPDLARHDTERAQGRAERQRTPEGDGAAVAQRVTIEDECLEVLGLGEELPTWRCCPLVLPAGVGRRRLVEQVVALVLLHRPTQYSHVLLT
jgi:hypothetical protein